MKLCIEKETIINLRFQLEIGINIKLWFEVNADMTNFNGWMGKALMVLI
jgi:hypothetical protein